MKKESGHASVLASSAVCDMWPRQLREEPELPADHVEGLLVREPGDIETKYSDDQPREPAGSPEGGQFAPADGGGGGTTTPNAPASSDSPDQEVREEDKERIATWSESNGGSVFNAMRDPSTKHGKAFTDTLSRMKVHDGTAYRGVIIKESEVETSFTVGQEMNFIRHSSSSQDRSIAVRFANSFAGSKEGKASVVLKIEGGPKPNIAKYAAEGMQQEKEVIVRAGTRYNIVSKKERNVTFAGKPSKYTEVTIRYVGGP